MRKATQSILRRGVSLVIVLSLVCGCGTLLFTGCNKSDKGRKIESAELNNLDVYYLTSSTIDFDAVTLSVTYDDGTTAVLRHKEYDVSDKDATDDTEFILKTDGLYEASQRGELTEGEYKISVSVPANKYTEDKTPVAVGSDYTKDLELLSFAEPALLSSYNKNLDEHTGKDSEDSFYNKSEGYFVGDDNAFTFMPEMNVRVKSTGVYGTFSDYDKDVSVTLVDDNLNASGESLNLESNDYVSFKGFDFDFTEDAVGETFEIFMSAPKGFDMDANGRSLNDVSMDVTVADGWNAYSALDLGMMNVVSSGFNISEYVTGDDEKSHMGGQPDEYFWDGENETHVGKHTYEIWKDFLKEEGYENLQPVNGIFLHGDITVTESDLPGEFLISEAEAKHYGCNYDAMVGTIRDGIKLYEKNIEDSDFTFNGNLFTVDCYSLRWAMTRLNNQGDFSFYPEGYAGTHTGSRIVVFGVQGLTDANTTKERHTATFENINAVGNAIDPNDEEGHAAGSPSFIESRSASTEVENCIVKNFLYAFRLSDSDESYVNLTADYDKVFDCYFSAIRVARSANNEVSHSELRRFSGPVVMEMCETEENSRMDSYYEAGITVDDSTEMENFISGTEAWFVSAGASSIATYISLADGVIREISGGTRTVLNAEEGNKINLLQFGHDTEDFGTGGVRLNTYFLMGDGVPFVLNESDALEPDGVASEELLADTGLYNAAVTNYFINEVPDGYLLPITFSTEKGEICALDKSMSWSFDPVELRNNGYIGIADSSEEYDREKNSIGCEVDISADAKQLYIYYDMGGVGLSLVVTLYEIPAEQG